MKHEQRIRGSFGDWVCVVGLVLAAACGRQKGPVTTSTHAGPLAAPNTPVVTEPVAEGHVVNAADVHLETGPFSDEDEGETHVCTDWEIWTVAPAERVWVTACITGAERLHTHLGDGVFEGSHAGLRQLRPETDYRMRVRFRDSSGDPEFEWSAWAERGFRTAPERPPLPGAPEWIVMLPNLELERVATGFRLPVNIAFVPGASGAPGRPLFYVAELYGQIKVVTSDFTVSDYATGLLNYAPNGVFPGSGEQGLSGIVVDPATGDLFAALLVDAGGPHYPRVVRLSSTDGGLTMSSRTTVLDMPGEPQGQSHQISNLSLGPDGKLYVHMGDGFDANTGRNLNSFRGKILRVNLDGSAPSDNPFFDATDGITARDYVFAYGLRNPFGGAWRPSTGVHYQVENGPSVDRLAPVLPGANFGYDGTDESMAIHAVYNWRPAHAPVNIAFLDPGVFHGSGFPASRHDHAFVTESGPTFAAGPQTFGKRIVEFAFAPDGSLAAGPTTVVEYNGTGRSSVAAIAPGPDGIYFSTLYADDPAANPPDAGASIFRLRYLAPGPPPAPGTGTGLRAEYFDYQNFTGARVLRQDPTVDFQWSAEPAAGIGGETFSVRWSGSIEPHFSETYTLATVSDDGVRLWVDGQLLIDQWNDHGATEHRATIRLTAGQRHEVRMEMYEAGGEAVARLFWSSPRQAREIVPQSQLYPSEGEPLPPPPPPPPPPLPPGELPPPGAGIGLAAEYFDNRDLTGTRVSRVDPTVDFQWGSGTPAGEIEADTFSARWTGLVEPHFTETYTFTTTSDDGVRLWVGGQLLVDQWTDHGPTEHSGRIDLVAGQRVPIRMEFYENGGGAVARLHWASARQAREIVPRSQLFPPAPVPPPQMDAAPPPSMDAGPPPSMDAGPPPSMDAGPPPSMDAGPPPSMDAGPPPSMDVALPPPTDPPPTDPPPPPPPEVGTGLFAEYYDDRAFTGTRTTRIDPTVDFGWGSGAPMAGMGVDTFSVRWTGSLEPRFTETYTFLTTSDDGVRLWVNGQLVIDQWTDHGPTEHTGSIALVAGQRYSVRLEFYENGGGAVARLAWTSARQAREIVPASQLFPAAAPTVDPPPAPPTDPPPPAPPTDPPPPPPDGSGTGLAVTYYDNRDFTGLQMSRVDPTVDFQWGSGAPMLGIGADTFSARWTGSIEPRFTEAYTFTTLSDDGVRLWVNGQLVIDQWTDHGPTEHSGTISLVASQRYDIRMEFYENGGGAVARLFWSSARQAREIVPTSQLFPSAGSPPADPPPPVDPPPPPPVDPPPPPAPPDGGGTGLFAEYYDNPDFTGTRATRFDATVDFGWGSGAPMPGMGVDTFSVRWSGRIEPRFSETITFHALADDGVRLWIDGRLIIDRWVDQPPTERSGSITLLAGQRYDIRMEYYENGGGAVARLFWSGAQQVREVIPASQLHPPP